MHKILVVMDVLDEHRLLLDNVNSKLDISYKKAAEVTPEDLVDEGCFKV